MNKITINSVCKIIGNHFGYSLKQIKDKISSRIDDELESPYLKIELEDKTIRFAVMSKSLMPTDFFNLDKLREKEAYCELRELLFYPNTEFVVLKAGTNKRTASKQHFFSIRPFDGELHGSIVFKDENDEYQFEQLTDTLQKLYPAP